MIAKTARFALILSVTVIFAGCSDEDEPEVSSAIDKYSDVEMQVRPLINRQGIVVRALDKYEYFVGSFPSTEQGLDALIRRPKGLADPKKWDGPYLDDPEKLIDPWGGKLQYKFPGDTKPKKYDLWSMGPDGQNGNEDDILCWNVK